MSCLLTTSLNWDCRIESGGIRSIYIVEYNEDDTVTKASGEISAHSLTGGRAYFRWDLPVETASLTAPIQVSQENGTVAYEATLSLRLTGLDTTKRNELKLAAKTRLRVIVRDNEDSYWMMGAELGANMFDGTEFQIGAGMQDFKGAMVVIRHREMDTINKVQASVITSLSLP